MNKALVTRASAVIPAVPLYIAILYKVMKEKCLLEVAQRWERADTASIQDLADVEGFRAEYLNYHGFGVAGIDYAAEVDP